MKKYIALAAAAMMAAMSAQAQTWTEVGTSSELTAAVADGAHIRLTSDITLPAYLSIGNGADQTVTLDLNGHTLSRNLSAVDANGHVIEIHSQGNLTIVDNASGGKISGGRANNGGGICNYGTLYFQGGTITNCLATSQGGGIKNNSGCNLYISGGAVSGCMAHEGAGICNDGGTAIISGGSINGNTANTSTTLDGLTPTTLYGMGGGIYNSGTMTISGAAVANNHADYNGGGIYCADTGNITIGSETAITNNSAPNGGGIYGIEGSTLSISGCTVTANTVTEDGGGIVNRGTLTVGDGTSITGNTCQNNGAGLWSIGTLNMSGTVTVQNNSRISGLASNVFLKSGHVITVTGSLGSSLIGVTLEGNEGVVTSGGATINNFTNDFPSFTTLGTAGGEVCLSKNNDVIYYIERSWDTTNQKVVETIRTVSVSECTFLDGTDNTVDYDTSSSKPYLVVRGTNAYRTITVSNNRSLILCDGASLSGNGQFSIIEIGENCQLNIYGQMYDTGQLKEGAIRVPVNRILNIHGGTINAISEASESAAIGGHRTSDVKNCGVINIYGGTITAISADSDGHDCSAGIGGAGGGPGGGSGGVISIYGGTVTARGGSADGIDNSAAGIGGSGSGSGGVINIHGGTVYAYGGDDAAGIGSGEEGSSYHCNGGTITITGGKVYAYGNDVAAGIGAGQYADMGTITITGGYVEAHGGGGEDWANAIATNDDTEGENSITLGDNMMVTSERDFTYPERYDAVKGRKDVVIKPCTHNGATYTVSNATTHRLSCSYCLTASQPHTFGSYSECTACHLVSLSNSADNSSCISHWNGQTKAVALTGRTLYKDGSWNTLCLPFDVSSFSGTPLAGATVKTLTSSTFSGGTLTLNFTEDANNLTSIEAGKPYIVKWATPATNVTSPVFSGVTISNAEPKDVTGTAANFHGIYSPYSTGGEDRTMLYLGADNTLYYPDTDLRAFTAYFPLTFKGLGDINQDGGVTVSDVMALVNIVLDKATDTGNNADINGDGSVDVGDVTTLVNIILGRFSDKMNISNINCVGLDPALEWGGSLLGESAEP